ncbi:saccharopine dehydrogenase NADP-binding domain-containing protein [Saccharibacillus sp. CPCC 101409]|uniref:saccharopine dehydrogenase NADP-binding domain-containing protein n=1 Tax=Saccharibacillus sp. CPCC 101409 TaxID=3058041 RepID=UPI002672B821|nr:saccharopine dehydrogenase NADP-binding domain-containing protein [Saccharibacillus sp. CPCC 101409]MDO3411942.1 saccharopine dehydrogenase NADP-binding domain-containing protein [Saccharibacillus sp. CPCC 101409]
MTNNKTDIVVIGGYGSVGGEICRLLAERLPGRVYAAGRNLEAAERFAAATGGAVGAMRWTIGPDAPRRDLSRIALIVMCLDQAEPDLLRQCLEEGTHYLDITAQTDFLLWAAATGSTQPVRSAALLSVGLAPGLTNLLAAKAARALDETERIEISLMLGLGEHHGRAAIEWTLRQMGAEFELADSGAPRTVRSMTGGRTADFGGDTGRKRVYRFPFSDQRTLPGTLGVRSVSTRLGFDVNGVARTAAGLRRAGFFRLLRRPSAQSAAVRLAGALHAGSERFAARVEAYGRLGGQAAEASCTIRGIRQSEITARVAAYAAEKMLARPDLRGVLHIEQWLDADEVWSAVRTEASSALEFERCGRADSADQSVQPPAFSTQNQRENH